MKHVLCFFPDPDFWGSPRFCGHGRRSRAETANGTTYRVYATFDNPTDELVAVYALEDAPMVVGVSTSFYQDAVGAVLAQTINPRFMGPSLQYDSRSPLVQRIPMARVTFNKWAWTRTSPILKLEEASPSTRSLRFWFLLPNQSADAEAGADTERNRPVHHRRGCELDHELSMGRRSTNTFNSEGISIVFPEVLCLAAPTHRRTTTMLWPMKTMDLYVWRRSVHWLSYDVVSADPLELAKAHTASTPIFHERR